MIAIIGGAIAYIGTYYLLLLLLGFVINLTELTAYVGTRRWYTREFCFIVAAIVAGIECASFAPPRSKFAGLVLFLLLASRTVFDSLPVTPSRLAWTVWTFGVPAGFLIGFWRRYRVVARQDAFTPCPNCGSSKVARRVEGDATMDGDGEEICRCRACDYTLPRSQWIRQVLEAKLQRQ